MHYETFILLENILQKSTKTKTVICPSLLLSGTSTQSCTTKCKIVCWNSARWFLGTYSEAKCFKSYQYLTCENRNISFSVDWPNRNNMFSSHIEMLIIICSFPTKRCKKMFLQNNVFSFIVFSWFFLL